MASVWTQNVITGVPTRHELIELNIKQGRAKTRDGWTMWGGFYLSEEDATEASRAIIRQRLREDAAFAKKFAKQAWASA